MVRLGPLKQPIRTRLLERVTLLASDFQPFRGLRPCGF